MQKTLNGPFLTTVTDYTYDIASSFFCYYKQDVTVTVALLKFGMIRGPFRLKTHFLPLHGIFTFQYISDQCFSNNFSCFKYFSKQFE